MEVIIGLLISYIIGSHFYQRSSCETPKWADDFIKNLPKNKPSTRELIKLFQESLDDGLAVAHEVTGHVACPECGEPSTNFKERAHFPNDDTTIVEVECPRCEWNTYGEA